MQYGVLEVNSTLHLMGYIFWSATWITTKYSPDLDIANILVWFCSFPSGVSKDIAHLVECGVNKQFSVSSGIGRTEGQKCEMPLKW